MALNDPGALLGLFLWIIFIVVIVALKRGGVL